MTQEAQETTNEVQHEEKYEVQTEEKNDTHAEENGGGAPAEDGKKEEELETKKEETETAAEEVKKDETPATEETKETNGDAAAEVKPEAAQSEGKNDYLDREKYRLDGYVIVITGGSAGVGKEAARDLALRGAKVVMGNRDLEKSANVIAALRSEEGEDKLPEDRLLARKLDLSDLASVRAFAEEVKKEFPVIDILINNAGKMGGHREVTGDGFESQFQTNHLGHFLLTHLLIDNVLASKNGPRIINLSSAAHKSGSVNFEDLQSEKSWGRKGFAPYAHTKLMNILFTKSLAEKYGDKVNTYAVHPGFVRTELGRYSKIASLIYRLTPMFSKNERQGALTTVYCAVSKKAGGETGLYYADSKVCASTKASQDMEVAQKLWEESCKLLDITWEP